MIGCLEGHGGDLAPDPGWRISVVSANVPEIGPPVCVERAMLHPWELPHRRQLSTADDVDLEHLIAETDPRLALDSCTGGRGAVGQGDQGRAALHGRLRSRAIGSRGSPGTALVHRLPSLRAGRGRWSKQDRRRGRAGRREARSWSPGPVEPMSTVPGMPAARTSRPEQLKGSTPATVASSVRPLRPGARGGRTAGEDLHRNPDHRWRYTS